LEYIINVLLAWRDIVPIKVWEDID